MSNFETINFDPNVLFSLSYNFEGLKVLLSQFSKNQKMIIDKLNGLENKTNQNSLYINNINIGLKNQGIEIGEVPLIEMKEEKHEKHSRVSSDLISNLGGGDNERIKDLEKKISKLNTFIPKFPEDKGKTLTDILDEYQYGLKGISDKNNELEEKIKKILEDLEEIKVKVADFNIYDIFKNTDNENGPNVDVVTGLIQNLDSGDDFTYGMPIEKYYSEWTVNNYTINFNYNGATGGNSQASKTVTYDSTYGTLPTPTREGYMFVGWNGKNLLNLDDFSNDYIQKYCKKYYH